MTVTYQTERLADTYAEAEAMLEYHWDEAATFKDRRKLNIDVQSFLRFEAIGKLILVTAREEGKLIGYIMGCLQPNLHSQDDIMAIQDAFYVYPEKRGHFPFLVRHYERECVARGATIIGARQKIKSDGSRVPDDRFLEVFGYVPVEVSWFKMADLAVTGPAKASP